MKLINLFTGLLLLSFSAAANASYDVQVVGYDYQCVTKRLRVHFTDPNTGAKTTMSTLLYQPEYYRPVPAVISLSTTAGVNPVDGKIAADLCARTIATVVVEVYSPEFMPSVNSLQTVENTNRRAMNGIREIVDALVDMKDIDENRLGMIGASMGGIIGAMYFPTDSRLKAYVNILGAGNVPEILTYSDNEEISDFRARIKQRYRLQTNAQFLELARSTIHLDPIAVSSPRLKDKILQVLLATDNTVPYRYQLALWEQSGRPQQILIPSGNHALAYVKLVLFGSEEIMNFLENKL